LTAKTERTLQFADVASLATLGVDVSRYESFDYSATQVLAAAAHFLEFDGMLVRGARHDSNNLVLFMDRVPPGSFEIKSSELADWTTWRRQRDRSQASRYWESRSGCRGRNGARFETRLV